MIKITLKDLLDVMASGALGRLASDKDLSAKVKFQLKPIWKSAVEKFESYNETRLELCREYGVLNEETNAFEFETPERETDFNAEIKELQSTEVMFEAEPLSVACLTKKIGSPDVWSAVDLCTLDWLIVEASPVAEEEKAEAATA